MRELHELVGRKRGFEMMEMVEQKSVDLSRYQLFFGVKGTAFWGEDILELRLNASSHFSCALSLVLFP